MGVPSLQDRRSEWHTIGSPPPRASGAADSNGPIAQTVDDFDQAAEVNPFLEALRDRPGAADADALRRLLKTLDAFGVDPIAIPKALRSDFLVALSHLTQAFAHSSDSLPKGTTASLETTRTPRSAAVELHLGTPHLDLNLRVEIGSESGTTYALNFETSEGQAFRAEQNVRLSVLPTQHSSHILASPLEAVGTAEPGSPETQGGTRQRPHGPHRDDAALEVPKILASSEGGRPHPQSKGHEADPSQTEPNHREGWRAFVQGALQGDFAENDAWSAMAGQFVVGFVPGLGQVADVRDVIAALDDARNREPGASIALGASVLGFIPGFDFLKVSGRLSRRAIRETVEDVSPIAREGMDVLATRISPSGLRAAWKLLNQILAGRAVLIERFQAVMDELPENDTLRDVLSNSQNAMQDHWGREDLVGALRDVHHLPVAKGMPNEMYQHFKEVREASDSLRRARTGIVARHQHQRITTGAVSPELSRLADASEEILRDIKMFMELK